MKTQNKKINRMYDLANNLIENSKKKINDVSSKIDKIRKHKAMEAFNDGVRLFKLKEKDTAIKELKYALFINPSANKQLTKEQIAFFIGRVYNSLGNTHKELQYYSKAINCNSQFFDAWFEKGLIYLDLGKRRIYHLSNPLKGKWGVKLTIRKKLYKESLYCFENAEKSDLKNTKATYYAGYLNELLNKPKEAMKIFDKVIEPGKNFDNVEKSELFRKVKDEPDMNFCVCQKCKSKLKTGDSYCDECGNKIKK